MMLTIQMGKINTKPLLTCLNILLLFLSFIFPQTLQTAHANTTMPTDTKAIAKHTPSSQVVVIAAALNVREAGTRSSQIIGIAHKGDRLTVIQTKNDWDQISLSNNQTGWISNTYVAKAAAAKNIEATVTTNVLNVRENPSLSSQIVSQLNMDTKVTIHEELDGWAEMVSAAGVQGWVYELYLTKDTPKETSSTKPEQSTVSSYAISKISTPQASAKVSRTLGIHSTAQAIKSILTQTKQGPLYGKTIVLDPGHGGIDDGTTSPITGTHEKTLTLATALNVEQKLKSAGAHVILTRTTDTFIPLQQRADLSNENHADAFISFHYNESSDTSANGILDFYYQDSRDSLLATDLLNEVAKSTGLQNDGTRFDNLEVLRNNTQPCTLIELGFLSNKHDDSIVENSTYRDQVAQGIYQGLIDYFSAQK